MAKIINYKNKFKILYQRIKNINGVYFEIKFNAGGFNDFKGKAGLAHFCEHVLMGFSTKTHSKLERRELMKKFVYYNAGTSFTFMNFRIAVPYWDLEEALDLMTEPFLNLKLENNEFEAEKKIIEDEIVTRVKNNTMIAEHYERKLLAKNKELINSELMPSGSLESLNNITLQDIENLIDKYFNQKNMIINVVGNISKSKLMKLIKKYIENRISPNGLIGFTKKDYIGLKNKKYVYAKPIEKDNSALLSLIYLNEKYDTTQPLNFRENLMYNILNSILDDKLFSFFRDEKELCYNTDVLILFQNIYKTLRVKIKCQEVALEKVLEAYKQFIITLPNDIEYDLFIKHKKKLEGMNNFDQDSLFAIANMNFNHFYNYLNLTKNLPKFTRKIYKIINYDDINQLYKKCFKVKPILSIISKNEDKYSNFDYINFIDGCYKK